MKIDFEKINTETNRLYYQFSECFSDSVVDIYNLIRRCGIRLEIDDFGEEFSGAAICDGTTKIIAINNTIPSERKLRFVAAHELGHLILHENKRLNVDRTFVAFFKKSELTKAERVQEEEADIFASTILLPKREVEPFVRDLILQGREEDEIIIKIAKKFKVPLKVASLRMLTIGYWD